MSKKFKNIVEEIEVNNDNNNLTEIKSDIKSDIKPKKKKRKTRKNKTDKVKIPISSEQAYCLKCKKACNVINKDIITNNNRKRMVGQCETCKTKVHKFLPKEK